MAAKKKRPAAARKRAPNQYHVYVIELKPEAIHAARRRERPLPKCYYVGQSVRTPEERYQQHVDGYKSASIVTRHHVRLRPDLFPAENPVSTRAEAEALEELVALALERAGHDVHWG